MVLVLLFWGGVMEVMEPLVCACISVSWGGGTWMPFAHEYLTCGLVARPQAGHSYTPRKRATSQAREKHPSSSSSVDLSDSKVGRCSVPKRVVCPLPLPGVLTAVVMPLRRPGRRAPSLGDEYGRYYCTGP